MKYYLKANAFCWNCELDLYDELQVPIYQVKTQRLIHERNISLSQNGHKIGDVSEKANALTVKFYISFSNHPPLVLKKSYPFLKSTYSIAELGWKVTGDFFNNNYQGKDNKGNLIFQVKEEEVAWGKVISIEIEKSKDLEVAIFTMLCIDAATIG